MKLDQLKDVCLQWLANVAGNSSNLPMAEARIRELFDAYLSCQSEGVSEDDVECAAEAVAEALGRAYDCNRVWNAWDYGTMGPSDFSMVADTPWRTYEIARAALTAVWHNRPAQEKEWEPYLKEGQTPFERFMQEVKDCEGAVELLRQARVKAEQAQEKAEPVSGGRLPKIPHELYEMYPPMSAQNHAEHVRAYARLAIAAVTLPAERARVPADAEAVSACLGDDAAAMLETNAEDERALNMQRAAQIIDSMLSAATEGEKGESHVTE